MVINEIVKSITLKTLTFLLVNSSLFCQTNKQTVSKTDSLLIQINKKIDAIFESKSKENTAESKEPDFKKQNKQLKKENELLNDQKGKYIKTIDSLKTVLKSEKQKISDELKIEKSNFKIKEKEYLDLITKEKTSLEIEINSILSQFYNLPVALVNSLKQRSDQVKPKPNCYNKFETFIINWKLIGEGYAILDRPYDASKIKITINAIEKIILDETIYSGLFQDKQAVLIHLNRYCEKTNEISKLIEDAAARINDEAKRIIWLEDQFNKVLRFPYLKRQMEAAISDRKYKLEKVTCQ